MEHHENNILSKINNIFESIFDSYYGISNHYKEDFDRELIETSYSQSKSIILAIMIVSVLLMVADYYEILSMSLFLPHLFLGLTAFFFWLYALLVNKWPAHETKLMVYKKNGTIVFLFSLLLVGSWIAFVDVLYEGDLIAYLIGVFGIAALVTMKPITSLILYSIVYFIFMIVLSVYIDSSRVSYIMVNGTTMVFFAWIISYISYRGKVESFNSKKIIEKRNLELQNLNREIESANERLKELDQMKSEFLSTVSHELRTPLTSILGFAKMIQMRLEDVILPLVASEDKKVNRASKQVRENVSIIISEGERLTQLINNVLDLAKMEAGKMELEMIPVSIEKVINSSCLATTSLFEDKNLTLAVEIEDDLPQVLGDENRLIQVVINLFSNAVKFSEKGVITCRARVTNNYVTVGVIDQGIGIALEDQGKVFEKFKQAGNVLVDKPKGTGLGLPICKEIVEQHSGKIWLESEFGQGSSFFFNLPALV